MAFSAFAITFYLQVILNYRKMKDKGRVRSWLPEQRFIKFFIGILHFETVCIMTNLDIIKLRRFSLAFGLLLVTFSLAGVEIDSLAKISPFGIPLVIKQPNLFGIGLALGSLYGLLRYWYYAVLIGLSPRKARKRLKSGTLIDGATTLNESTDSFIDIKLFAEEAQKQFDRYFPIIPGLSKLEVTATRDSSGCNVELPTVPFHTKLLVLLHDIDYYAPI